MMIKKINVAVLFGALVILFLAGGCPRKADDTGTTLGLKTVGGIGYSLGETGVSVIYDSGEWVKNGNEYESSPLVYKEGDASLRPKYGEVFIVPNDENAKVELSSPVSITHGEKITEGTKNNGELTYVIRINLRDYENIVKVKVSSPDGKKVKNYTLKMIRDTETPKGSEAPFWFFIDNNPYPESLNFTEKSTDMRIKKEPTPSAIKIRVKAKMPKSILGIDKAPANRTDEKTFNLSTETDTVIKIKDKNGVESSYTVHFLISKKDCTLRTLTIDKYARFDFDPNILEYFDVPLPYEQVTFTAIPNVPSAKVEINGYETGAARKVLIHIASLLPEKTVTVKVTNEGKSTEYKLNIVKAETNKINCKILVVDSIGGTKVTGTKLKIFDTVQNTQVGTEQTVADGFVTVQLDPNKTYDFELIGEKGKWAGSKLENYYINAYKNQEVTLYQYVHGQIERDVLPPKIISITESGKSEEIKDGTRITSSFKNLIVKFLSPSGMVRWVEEGGFGAKLGFGTMPSWKNGIYGQDLHDAEYKLNGWEQQIRFELDPSKVNFPKGQTNLIIVAYDVANNRLERHIYVDFNQEQADSTLEFAEISDLHMISRRMPFSVKTFSVKNTNEVESFALNPVHNKPTSYVAILQFDITENGEPVRILGFDIHRKKSGSSEPFKRVSRKLYGTLKIGSDANTTHHTGWDTDSLLEENVEYDYKIVAFNKSYSKESQVFKCKILESFENKLSEPENNKVIEPVNAQNLKFSCTITNTKFLDGDYADLISFGLFIAKKNGEVEFVSRCHYVFKDKNKGGKNDIRLFISPSPYSVSKTRVSVRDMIEKGLLASYGVTEIDQLITCDKDSGKITFTDKFVAIPFFNIAAGKEGFPLKLQHGSYQWDITDAGTNHYSFLDDLSMQCIKFLGDSGEAFRSHSQGNTETSSVNGRFEFTVK